MNALSDDLDLLHAYLDEELDGAATLALEARLKSEPALAELLVSLAREDAVLAEWSRSMNTAEQLADEAPALALAENSEKTPAKRAPAWFARTPRWLRAAAILLALLGLFVALSWRSESLASSPIVKESPGNVYIVTDSGETIPARPGLRVHPGQWVKTIGEGSFAVLEYPDATRLELSTDTGIQVRTSESAGKSVYLADGLLRAEVARQPEGRPMILATRDIEIRLPEAGRSVFSALGDATRVDLEEGRRLEGIRTHDGKPFDVQPGFYAVASQKRAEILYQQLPTRLKDASLTLTDPNGPIVSIAVSADERTVASAGWDGSIPLWDIEKGVLLRTLTGHTRKVRLVRFSADGRLLVSSSDDKTVRLWDPIKGTEIAVLKQRFDVDAMAVSPDGSRVVTTCPVPGNLAAEVKLWDVATGKEIGSFQGHNGPITVAVFAPDGKTLATGSKDWTIRLWNLATLEAFVRNEAEKAKDRPRDRKEKNPRLPVLTEQVRLDGHRNFIQSLAFSPDGQSIASGGRDGALKLWDVRTGQETRMLEGFTREVRAVAFSPDGKIVASAHDNLVKLWDLDEGEVRTTVRGHGCAVPALLFTPCGRTLVTCGWTDRTIKVWKLVEEEKKAAAVALGP